MDAKTYWAERAIQSRKIVDKVEASSFYRMNKILSLNLKSVEKQIKAFDLESAKENLTAKQTSDIKDLLRSTTNKIQKDKYLAELYTKDAKLYRINRLEGLKASIQSEMSEMVLNNEKDILSTVLEVGVETNTHNLATFKNSFGLDLNGISQKQIEVIANNSWVGSANYSQRIWADRYAVGKKLDALFVNEFVQGKSLATISKKVKDKFQTSTYNAMRLVRTEATHMHSQADLLYYDEIGSDRYEYHAYLDSRTSDICRELDNKTFLTKNAQTGVNLPPMHPNCRSTSVPLPDYDKLSKKYGLTEQDFLL